MRQDHISVVKRQLAALDLDTVDQLAETAAKLTTKWENTLKDLWRFQGIVDPATKRERALSMLDKLARYRQNLEPALVDRETVAVINTAIHNADYELLGKLGVSTEYVWLDDIAAAMINGGPFLFIETVSPYASYYLDSEGELDVDITRLPEGERAGAMISALIREVTDGFDNITLVALLDEQDANRPERPFTEEEKDLYVVGMSRILEKMGVIRPNDRAGREFLLIRESALSQKLDLLERRLQDSGKGRVEQTPSGDTLFLPSASVIDSFALHSNNRVREFRRQGILLRKNNVPTCHALDAARYLDPIYSSVVHLVVLEEKFKAQQDKVYALLRASGILRQDNFHNVFYDPDHLSAELVAYTFCRLLEAEVLNFLENLEAFDHWAALDPVEYVSRNFPSHILTEDREIISFVIKELESSPLAEKSALMVANVGAGPNLYPAMMLTPYIADTGSIDMIEYGPVNRAYTDGIIREHRISADNSWQGFEDFMVQQGGDRYAGAFRKVCRLANVIDGSIYALPENRYDILSACFTAESITASRREFRLAMNALTKAIKPDGILVTAHIVGSQGWYAGVETNFPAVDLTVTDIKEAYRDAGLTFILMETGENVPDKARDGYHSMVAVISSRQPQNPLERTATALRHRPASSLS